MIRYTLKRILLIIPVVIVVALAIFTIMYFCPGDPAETILGGHATEVEIDELRTAMGLNDPFVVQLGRFLKEFFLEGNLGTSYISQKDVMAEILTRFPRTLFLSVACIVLNVLIGIPLGVTAATHRNGLLDKICMLLALVGVSLPNFWVALELVIIFALSLDLLPAYGFSGPQYYILPVIAGSLDGIAHQARQTRSSMLEVIRSDYITTVRSQGFAENTILYKYALPNALIPVLQTLGNIFARSLGGTLIIENIFSIPGLGTYLSTGISNRDYPIVRGCVIFLAVVFSIVMLLVDLAFAYIDPRIKAQYEGQNKKNKLWGRKRKS